MLLSFYADQKFIPRIPHQADRFHILSYQVLLLRGDNLLKRFLHRFNCAEAGGCHQLAHQNDMARPFEAVLLRHLQSAGT